MKHGKQQTVTWHVDGLKSSNVYPKLNGKFTNWCKETYVSDNLGNEKVIRGKIHNYLGMIMNFNQEGFLKIDMKYYTKGMLE